MNRVPPLVRLLQRRTLALKRHLPGAKGGDDRAVHQARVASRRLREAVPVLSSGLHGSKAGKARRKIRRLTQALGTVRELDVTLQVLDQIGETPGIPRSAVLDVRAHVMEERERRRTIMLERLGAVNAEKLGRRLDCVRDALQHPSPEHRWRETLGTRVAKKARSLTRAIEAAGQIYAPEALHQVRIASKKLRYALELVDESGAARAAAEVRTVKKVQDALGRLHDLQILLHHIAEVAAAPRVRRSVPDPGLDVLSRRIEEECRHLHGRYVAMLPPLREVADAARHDIAVRLSVAPRRARSAKMSLGSPRRRAAGGHR